MYKAPTVTQISQALRAAVRTELPQSDAWVWPNNLYVLTKAFAQGLRGLYLRLEWLHRQARVATAEGADLEGHASDIGITRLEAAQAAGTATAVTTVGTEIPQGTRLLRGDDVAYETTEVATATATATVLKLKAVEPGADGNAVASAPLDPETPITGLGTVTVDAAGLTGGADTENDEDLRARVLLVKRNPPHGGSPAEYIGWARGLAGVTRVFVKRAFPQAGSVTVIFLMDEAYGDGIPQAGDVAALEALLETMAPASADIVVAAPVPVTVDVTIANLSPDNARVRDAVNTELEAMFRRRSQPGSSADPFIFSRSWVSEAVSMATGEVRHQLTLPAADVTVTEDSAGIPELAVLGTVTFT